MTKVKDKVVWITGASSGIGEALAYEFAKRGSHLILSARREKELLKVKGSCVQNVRIHILPLDLADSESLKDKANAALEFEDGIDILINNGGISMAGTVKDTLMEVDRRVFEINFFGTIALTKLVLPNMTDKKAGHIVVISSVVGKFSTPTRSSYSASKHALHGYFDALRSEVWDDNIKVTIICPGFVQTEITKNSLTSSGEKLGVVREGQKNGIPVDLCARKIISAIENDKSEVYIAGLKEKMGVIMKRFAPRLLNRMMRKMKVT